MLTLRALDKNARYILLDSNIRRAFAWGGEVINHCRESQSEPRTEIGSRLIPFLFSWNEVRATLFSFLFAVNLIFELIYVVISTGKEKWKKGDSAH